MNHALKILSLLVVLACAVSVGFAQDHQNVSQQDQTMYQLLKANGLLSQPVQVPAPRNADIPFTPQLCGNSGLPIPLDGSFTRLNPPDTTYHVAPFTNGSPPLYRNDDGSTDSIPLSFSFTFFGLQYRRVYINNNGNISFSNRYGTYTSTGFPIRGNDMIAAFWADVDTRGSGSGVVYYKSEAHRFTILWDSVGYFSSRFDKRNAFEIIISDGTDPIVGAGNNICIAFAKMQWTTGSASGGTNGFGGTPATVGINRGDSTNYALIGRFNHAGYDYDGPGGNPDGVSYLDGKRFCFNIAQGLGTVTGLAYQDLNSNCIYQTNEPKLPGWTIKLTSSTTTRYATTDTAGNYFFSFLAPGTYTVSEVPRTNWQQTCPTGSGTYTVVLDSGQTVRQKDFANQPTANVQDLAISVAGGIARPGFQKFYGIRYDNKGTVSVSGTTVKFTHPVQVTYQESSPGGTYDNASKTVTWNVGSFSAGATGWQWVKVQIPNTVGLGTNLTSSGRIDPTSGDAHPFDNYDDETQVVRGSFDPNDISVTPSGSIALTDTLEYLIRFQNTGTDTAFNVRVVDSLDADLDISTFVAGAGSHAYTFSIVPPNSIVFTFAHINLLDSTANEPMSHGFVKFRIQPRSGLAAGTDIANQAAIFFDFNPAVMTNTVHNQIAQPAGHTVYAGDANNDNIVNVRDILPIGQFFGLTGPVRPGGSLNWGPQLITQSWTPEAACYADCDGNGTVGAADVQGIINNWSMTHSAYDRPTNDKRTICEALLREIDTQQPLSNGMKEVRNAVVFFMKTQLGVTMDYALQQNWPNPFNPSTTIRFTVPEELKTVNLAIYNLLGQVVWMKTFSDVQPGNHEVIWSGETLYAVKASSGVYIYRLSAGSYSAVKRMTMIK